MASLISVSIDVSKLPKEKFVKGAKGVYYKFTIGVNDTTNQYGQNVSMWDEQTEEERSAKKKKLYLGNGKVFWTDNNIVKAEPKQNEEPVIEDNSEDDGLPF
ncbi:MAG: hypothetical protein ACTSQA_05585 [Candidatus Heimdallarchaeaceae archaeon]|tara:strand:- start:1981 stop:2286 length:306 start_codon:yes stop_codon:yes gene_type:complete